MFLVFVFFEKSGYLFILYILFIYIFIFYIFFILFIYIFGLNYKENKLQCRK